MVMDFEAPAISGRGKLGRRRRRRSRPPPKTTRGTRKEEGGGFPPRPPFPPHFFLGHFSSSFVAGWPANPMHAHTPRRKFLSPGGGLHEGFGSAVRRKGGTMRFPFLSWLRQRILANCSSDPPPPPPSGGPSPAGVRRPDIKYYWEFFSGARKRPASLKRGGKDYPPD